MSASHDNGIFVVGSTNVDMCSYVERMPRVGETIKGTRFQQSFGGKGANQAIASALLGAPVYMLTKVGSDQLGKGARENYQHYGVDCRFVREEKDQHTGVASITIDANGDNQIIITPGANEHLLPEDFNDEVVEKIWKSSIVVAQLEVPFTTVLKAFQTARDGKQYRPLTILNPAPASLELPEGTFANTDIIVPNETEAELLTGTTVETFEDARMAAKTLCGFGPTVAIITLGSKGAFLLAETGSDRSDSDETENAMNGHNEFFSWTAIESPFHTANVVDTVGAGDAFIGAFAFALRQLRAREEAEYGEHFISRVGTNYANLVKATKFACACGSYSVQIKGAQASLPSTQDAMMELLG
eukprot:gb/GECG01015254.1/.p1 GENE.gb/GECG01015254.1/~~gb/GECG01015254.1/.p1  ORF type:complete len:358 (+),score=43.84 gb/GECG01015254.1/:1-1074(+)